MKTARPIILLALVLSLPLAAGAWAVDEGQTKPRLNSNETPDNNTVDIIPLTSGSGNIKGFQCKKFPGDVIASIRLHFYVDGGAAQTIDPGGVIRLVDANGDHYSAAFPMNIRFGSSIRVTLQKTFGTGTIWCAVSWALD